MYVWRLILMSGLLGGLVVAAPGSPSSTPKAHPGSYRIGLIRGMFRNVPEAIFPMLASPFKKLMRDRVGMTGEVCLVADAETLAGQLESGKSQLGVFGGVEFAWARTRYPNLRPLALAIGREARPTAVVVVKKDSPIKTLDDLKARPAVLPRDSKDWCRLYVNRRCPKPEAGISYALAVKLVEPASGADALDDVIDERIPATVVDGGTLKLYVDLKPHRAALLRTISCSQPFPATAIVYRQGAIDVTTRRRFLHVLTGSKQTQQYKDLMRLWRMKGFEPVPADYNEQLAQVLKAYPPPEGFCSSK